MGFPYSDATFKLVPNIATGSTYLSYIMCSGNETNIGHCPRLWDTGGSACDHTKDIGVVCSGTPQIYSVETSANLKLYVTANGQKGTVCNNGFSVNASKLACRQLKRSDAIVDVESAGSGSTDSFPVVLQELQCPGEANNLGNCSHKGWQVTNCSHSDDVILYCGGKAAYARARVGANNILLATSNGEMGTVCSKHVNAYTAIVACREMGRNYHEAVIFKTTISQHSYVNLPIVFGKIVCHGHETAIRKCYTWQWKVHTCVHSQDLMINCKDKSDYVHVTYRSLIQSAGCYFFNETTGELELSGCWVGKCSTMLSTQCICTHLTDFMSSVVVPPIQIDMSDSAWLKLDSNPIAFSLCLSVVCFWFLVVIWARRRDQSDLIMAGVTPLPCNDPRDKFSYEITIWTGRRANAGTTSHVTLILSGDNSETYPRLLRDPERSVLQRGYVDSFLLTTHHYLGDIVTARFYHDNTGSSPGWYFSRMMVEDLQTKQKYYFLSDQWLSIDEDDGLIDRTLVVAGKEEINGFNHVFWTRTSKNLFDGHLWFSVVTRPPRSKFTRVQRATCCLVIIMWTMMVNLMFYGQEEEVESPKLFEIGPIRVSPHSIYMATVSALIVIPINVLIVVLFRNRRDRVKVTPMKQQVNADPIVVVGHDQPSTSNLARILSSTSRSSDWAIRDNSNHDVISLDDIQHESTMNVDQCIADTTGQYIKPKSCKERITAVINRIFPFPWWTFIIGYILSFASVATCTFLMVEFGGVLGEMKTSEWLASMSISLLQSIIIIQPIKILAIVMLYTLVIKTPEVDEDEVSKELMLLGAQRMHEEINMEDLNNPEKYHDFKLKKKAEYPPPPTEELEAIRQTRQKDKKTQTLLNDCLFYIFFVIIITAMAYTNQDYRTFLQNDAISKLFVKRGLVPFKSIRNYSDIWDYLENDFVPNLYPTACYNNKSCDLVGENSINDLQLIRLRQAQLRLLRISPQSTCKPPKEIEWFVRECHENYNLFEEDTESYIENWIPKNKFSDPDPSSPWEFTSALKLYGTPHWGMFATYGGGGYVATLGPTFQDSIKKIRSLRKSRWINQQTRGVFLEFLLYNTGTNLYTFSVMLLEQFSLGGFFAYPKFYTFRMNRYFGLNAVVYLTTDAISAILIFIFVIREIKAMKRMGKKYFKDFWSMFDLCLVIACFVGTGFYGARIAIRKAVSSYLQNNTDKFINFEWIAFWEECNQAVVGVIVFLFTLRFLKLLAFNYKISMLARVLSTAKTPLAGFMIIFALIFFAFAQMGYLLFFKTVDAFQSFSSTVETLAVMSLNKFDFMKFAAGGGTLGLFYFFVYMVFIAFIMVNFFVTIISEAFTTVKNNPMPNQYEIVEYCLRKLSSIFGCFKTSVAESRNVEKRFQYLDNNVDDWMATAERVDDKLERLLIRFGEYDESTIPSKSQ